jgi:hypothetical protein
MANLVKLPYKGLPLFYKKIITLVTSQLFLKKNQYTHKYILHCLCELLVQKTYKGKKKSSIHQLPNCINQA